ncbi:orotate phosphoribosyltransferase [Engelhardtia mirabilis]|uniref:Orotate phosphoribosyltransferase n=1 Tax=Engelhardtia mirabilis TaxID=2528011 RepID=A0A518BRU8_9BACT|nr:Orotate phosphoribosyltransferase [Planctomycetes bacterium Pla133]QDV04023.1 Orotate phosphoribosyltransferase [Planctomycetes bacterium Pla86]
MDAGKGIVDTDEVLDLLRAEDALLEGHFLLSSGLRSDRYFQCALALANPVAADKLARAFAQRLAASSIEAPQLVVGPAMGAVVWSQEVARALGLRSFFTERVDGQFALRRGFKIAPGTKVLVVEDVVTTGGSAKEVITLLRGMGAEVVGVGSVVNRSGGQPFADVGLELVSLAQVQARTWSADDVPAEFVGTEPIKPGSRPGL